MITGNVNNDLDALIRLPIRDANGIYHSVEVQIDTGYDGELAMPMSFIGAFGMTFQIRQEGVLADGSVHGFDVFSAEISWHGSPRTVEVEAVGPFPLLGMRLMRRCQLRIAVRDGGAIEIEPIP